MPIGVLISQDDAGEVCAYAGLEIRFLGRSEVSSALGTIRALFLLAFLDLNLSQSLLPRFLGAQVLSMP